MADYNDILASETDPNAPLKSSLFKRLVANPIAMAEGDDTSPIVRAGWHPFDKSVIGGSGTGLIYDSAVHGSVATITTPDFEDGYEYRFKGVDLTNLAGDDLQVDLFRETSGGYAGYMSLRTSPAGTRTFSFDLTIGAPRLVESLHSIEGLVSTSQSGNSLETADLIVSRSVHHSTAQKILRLRFRNTLRNIAAGRIYMFRRLLP